MGKRLKNGLDKTDTSMVLKCALDIKGISFRELARLTNISPSSISGYVTGTVLPSEDAWVKICRVLDIPQVCKEPFDPNDDADLAKREHNRLLFFSKELSAREDRRKKWIELFLVCGYPEEEIKHYVGPIHDQLPDKDIEDVANEFKARQIMDM